MDIALNARQVVDAVVKVHKSFGPELLESTCQARLFMNEKTGAKGRARVFPASSIGQVDYRCWLKIVSFLNRNVQSRYYMPVKQSCYLIAVTL
jgi:hypothetical protein